MYSWCFCYFVIAIVIQCAQSLLTSGSLSQYIQTSSYRTCSGHEPPSYVETDTAVFLFGCIEQTLNSGIFFSANNEIVMDISQSPIHPVSSIPNRDFWVLASDDRIVRIRFKNNGNVKVRYLGTNTNTGRPWMILLNGIYWHKSGQTSGALQLESPLFAEVTNDEVGYFEVDANVVCLFGRVKQVDTSLDYFISQTESTKFAEIHTWMANDKEYQMVSRIGGNERFVQTYMVKEDDGIQSFAYLTTVYDGNDNNGNKYWLDLDDMIYRKDEAALSDLTISSGYSDAVALGKPGCIVIGNAVFLFGVVQENDKSGSFFETNGGMFATLAIECRPEATRMVYTFTNVDDYTYIVSLNIYPDGTMYIYTNSNVEKHKGYLISMNGLVFALNDV